jgi:hypothetical protein
VAVQSAYIREWKHLDGIMNSSLNFLMQKLSNISELFCQMSLKVVLPAVLDEQDVFENDFILLLNIK